MKLLLICTFFFQLAYGETRVFQGLARHEGQAVYQTEQTFTLIENRPFRAVSFYTDQRGVLLGKLTSEFWPHRFAPAFLVQDFRQKRQWGLRYVNKRPVMFTRREGLPEQTLPVSQSQLPLLAGEGLAQFILTELERLVNGESIRFLYLFPAQLEARPYLMRALAVKGDLAEIEIVSSYWWGKFLLHRQRFFVDRQQLFIRKAEGTSVLFSADSMALPVNIEFIRSN